MKQLLLFCLISIALCGRCWSQTSFDATQPDLSDYRNIVHAEILGNTTAGISVNYTRLFPLKTAFPVTIALRAGLGKVFTFNFGKADNSFYVALPAEVSVYAGKSNIMPEVGLGLTMIQDLGNYPVGVTHDKTRNLLLMSLGLRLQEEGDRFFFKGGLTFGLMDVSTKAAESVSRVRGIIPGISLGRSF